MSFHSLPSVTRKPLRILMLNQYFPPDTSATAKIAAAIVKALGRKHKVTVLAGRPSYNPEERHPVYLWRRTQWDEDGISVTVERVGSTTYGRSWPPGRAINYLSYLAMALPRALCINCDVIIAMTDPPVAGVLGALVSRLRRCPFLYNIQDLHPDMALAAGMVKPNFFVRGWDKIHRWALKQADRLVVLGEDMRERVIRKGVSHERTSVVRFGFPLPNRSLARNQGLIEEIRCRLPFVVVYAGNLGFAGALETVLDAAKELKDSQNQEIGIVFIGEGAAREQLELKVQGLDLVRFLEYRPPSDMPCILAAGDLHIVTVRPGVEGLVVPSKLYPILAAGRPVLAVAPKKSDVARIVQEHCCGLVADPEDPHEVAKSILWARQHPEELQKMGERARCASELFTLKCQLAYFMQLVEEVAVTHHHSRN